MMPFTVAMIIPTGIGAAIGGHAGDAPAAKRGTIEVSSYMEAAGALVAIREGIAPSSLNREPSHV